MKRSKKNGWSPDRIKKLRKRLSFTQKQLAEKLGVHVITVTRWETGSSEPSALAKLLLRQFEA